MPSIDTSNLLAMRNAILQQNSALQKAASSANAKNAGGVTAKDGDFGSTLQTALGKVNDLQNNANAISESYEKGETTDIAAVMLSRQQASVGFQATLQVRNKLLAAYKDIMSMPV
jgi:flagellar hook-basal body complex protein FliE